MNNDVYVKRVLIKNFLADCSSVLVSLNLLFWTSHIPSTLPTLVSIVFQQQAAVIYNKKALMNIQFTICPAQYGYVSA